MVLKGKLKIIFFFVFCFLCLSLIILFPGTSADDLRKKHDDDLKQTLSKYKDDGGEEWKKFKDKPITISFWHNLEGIHLKDLQDFLKEFKEEYKNITVKTEFKGGWGQLIKNINVALPGNTEPHLIFSYPDYLINFYESGKLVPLNGFINHQNKEIQLEKSSDELSSNYFYPVFEDESQIKLGQEDKKWYSLPFFKTIELMFYNQTYFKKLQEKVKNNSDLKEKVAACFDQNEEGKLKNDITWEDLENLCSVIKSMDKNKIPIAYESESNLFIVASEQKGIPYAVDRNSDASNYGVKFNNLASQNMVKAFKERFYDQKYLTTKQLSGEIYPLTRFINQDFLMNISSSKAFEYLNKVDFEIGVTSCPYWKDGSKKALQQGANINLFYKQDKDEVLASWLLLKHLTSDKINKKLFDKKGSFPTRPSYVKNYLDTNKSKIASLKEDIKKSQENLNKPENDATQKRIINHKLLKEKLLLFILEEKQKEKKEQKSIYFFSPVFQKSYIARLVVEDLLIDCFLLPPNEKIDAKIQTLFNAAQKKALS
nr:sugar binding periplasmic protein PoStoSP18 [Candidatus Phytoplasma solani]WMV96794.1 sugar binding periplasmic protein PoStoSP18 [Candidatus Phytoplasma solani]